MPVLLATNVRQADRIATRYHFFAIGFRPRERVAAVVNHAFLALLQEELQVALLALLVLARLAPAPGDERDHQEHQPDKPRNQPDVKCALLCATLRLLLL